MFVVPPSPIDPTMHPNAPHSLLLHRTSGADLPSGTRGVPRCSRRAYVLWGLFLGSLGVHNFVAGRRFHGLIQIGISVASMGLLAPVSALWAWIECGTVTRDGDGVPFRATMARVPQPAAPLRRAA